MFQDTRAWCQAKGLCCELICPKPESRTTSQVFCFHSNQPLQRAKSVFASLPWPTFPRKRNSFPGKGVEGLHIYCSFYVSQNIISPCEIGVRFCCPLDIFDYHNGSAECRILQGYQTSLFLITIAFTLMRYAGFLVMQQCCEPGLLLQFFSVLTFIVHAYLALKIIVRGSQCGTGF